jgi:hypothetical protein
MEKIEAATQPEIIATWIVAAKALIKSNSEASKAFRRVIQKTRFNKDGSRDPSTGPERSKLENTRRELGRVTFLMLVLVAALQGKRLVGGVLASPGSHAPADYVRCAVYELVRTKKWGKQPLSYYGLLRGMEAGLAAWSKAALDPSIPLPELQWLLPKLELQQEQHTAAASSAAAE